MLIALSSTSRMVFLLPCPGGVANGPCKSDGAGDIASMAGVSLDELLAHDCAEWLLLSTGREVK